MYQQPNYNNYYPQRTITPTLNLKGHPVASFEEVKASAVDFDGTISYFPDVANNCIYTKQINIDGTVTLKKFGLTELPNEQPPQDNNYITREEFEKTMQELKESLNNPTKKEEEKTSYNF